MHRVLIIDDDRDICIVLSRFLEKKQYEVKVAHTGEQGLKELKAAEFDLILCDYRLPDMTGVDTLKKIKLLRPRTAVIIITGYSDVKSAVETFRYGASDYVTKPLYPDELLVTISETIAGNSSRHAEVNHAEVGESESPRHNGKALPEPLEFIVGKSEQAMMVQRYTELIAPADMSVIIIGETGTGKEFVAKSIHKLSKRSDKPFVAIDCGALPRELAGSELFGHTKGSFTGAILDKPGSFELANDGTIFLDEVGNLSYENQVNLLRVLQERRVKRIGATKDIPVDVRIIAATNEDLSKAVKEGRFREDLYHRLNEFKIQLSPIRERPDDIIVFANHFLKKSNQSLGKNIQSFSPAVIDQMSRYYWYGNLRELNNVIKRAVLLTTGDEIQMESLPQEIVLGEIQGEIQTSETAQGSVLKSAAGSAERQVIIETLEKSNFNKSKAAELLKIDRKTLYNKLRLYNIDL